MPKNAITYSCERCGFVCNKKSNFQTHCLTRKHQLSITLTDCQYAHLCTPVLPPPSGAEPTRNPTTDCKSQLQSDTKNANVCFQCQKEYKDGSGLWRHNKKYHSSLDVCVPTKLEISMVNTQTRIIDKNAKNAELSFENAITKENAGSMTELMMELIKQNQEIKDMMLNQLKIMNELKQKPAQTTTNNTTTTNVNLHFNLNVFLNEKCKHAMNMSEFLERLEVGFGELETVGKVGYVEGISRMIVSRLKALDVYERPIHCTDMKRETIYIKDQDKWDKDSNHKFMNVIQCVANKNMKMIPQWQKAHPNSSVLDTKEYEQHMSIMIESIGGIGGSVAEKTEKNNERVLRNILKRVVVEKEFTLKTI